MSDPCSRPKVIFAGTSDFAVPALKALHQSAEIILVLTQPRKPAGRGLKERHSAVDIAAQELGLNILHPETLKRSVFEETLTQYPCDFLIVASYGKIVPRWMLEWPREIALNIHGSLLPRWRGASPIQHALLYGDRKTGVDIMEMTAGLDEGPVFLQREVEILKTDTQVSLTKKMAQLGADALIETLSKYPLPKVEQVGEVTYAPKILKEHGQVNWESTAEEIINQFRALTPWPGLFSFDSKQQRVKFLDLDLDPHADLAQLKPGQSLISKNKLLIQTGDGAICVHSLQWEGKKFLSIEQALKTQHPSFNTDLSFV